MKKNKIMPYIKENDRKKYDNLIDGLVHELEQEYNPGELNYVISKIIWTLFEKKKKYSTANNLIGTLEAVKLEFYRRQVADYENLKKDVHGDLKCH